MPSVTFSWFRDDANPDIAIEVEYTPGWSLPGCNWRSPDRCFEAEGEELEITRFAIDGDRCPASWVLEFAAEYESVADVRELVAMACERDAEIDARDEAHERRRR